MAWLIGQESPTQYVLCQCGCCLGAGTLGDERCPVCAGRGTVPAERDSRKCITCNGVGKIDDRNTGEFRACPVCRGQGILPPVAV